MRLNFTHNYILENEYVRLEPLQNDHLEGLFKISQDTSIWTYFFEGGTDKKSLIDYITVAINKRKEAKEYPFTIFDKTTQQFAGSTRFYEYSFELKNVRLGHTWLGLDFQGKKINKNVKYLLFEFAFETLNLERIGLGAYSDNYKSINAMKSVGCVEEGVLRNLFPSLAGNGRTDAILFSILKQDWFSSVKNELKTKIL